MEEETRTRDSALDKAQILIRKLNEECEATAKRLSKTDKLNESLKKQVRQNERNLAQSFKKMEKLDVMSTTEQRLRQEV